MRVMIECINHLQPGKTWTARKTIKDAKKLFEPRSLERVFLNQGVLGDQLKTNWCSPSQNITWKLKLAV